tara:strand:- start:461 stop:688 length:228 start_codon:yes stop_codon:yes gene_type:complete
MPASAIDFDRVGFSTNLKDFRISFNPKRFFRRVNMQFAEDSSNGFVSIPIKFLTAKHQNPMFEKHVLELFCSTAG